MTHPRWRIQAELASRRSRRNPARQPRRAPGSASTLSSSAALVCRTHVFDVEDMGRRPVGRYADAADVDDEDRWLTNGAHRQLVKRQTFAIAAHRDAPPDTGRCAGSCRTCSRCRLRSRPASRLPSNRLHAQASFRPLSSHAERARSKRSRASWTSSMCASAQSFTDSITGSSVRPRSVSS